MRKRFLLATIVWVVFITYACLTTAKNIPEAAWLDIPNKDKIVHCVFYFVFTLLLVMDYKAKTATIQRAWLYAFFTAVGYGILIEICQGLFTSGRNADVLDAIANTTGSGSAIFVLWLFRNRKK